MNPMTIRFPCDGFNWEFQPKPDITAYELSLIVAWFMYADSNPREHFISRPTVEQGFRDLPPEAKRHFLAESVSAT